MNIFLLLLLLLLLLCLKKYALSNPCCIPAARPSSTRYITFVQQKYLGVSTPTSSAPLVTPFDMANGPPTKHQNTHKSGADSGSTKEPCWTAVSWLSSLPLQRVIAESLLREVLSTVAADTSEADQIKALDRVSIQAAIKAAVPAIVDFVLKGVEALNSLGEVDAGKLNDKFKADGTGFEYSYGDMKDYHGGLEGRIGLPSPQVLEQMEAEHTKSKCANIPFVFGDGTSDAAKEWDYVANQSAVVTGGREQGQEGWLLEHFINFNGEDCVQILALVDTETAGRGTLTSVLTTEANDGKLSDNVHYTVRLPDGQQGQFLGKALTVVEDQFLGKALNVVEDHGNSAKAWLTLHGMTGKLKLKPVISKLTMERGLLKDTSVAFNSSKFAGGLVLDLQNTYDIDVGGSIRKWKGGDIQYCGGEFEAACQYEVELHTLDAAGRGGLITVQGKHLVWHDSVFRADLTKVEVIGLRLYTGLCVGKKNARVPIHRHIHSRGNVHTNSSSCARNPQCASVIFLFLFPL